jgi:hypothetical protein
MHMSSQPRANEPTLQDPRPRERRRSRSSFRHLAGGALLGAALFALVAWGISMVTGDGFPVLLYVIALGVGSGVGMGLLPFLSLARQDGTDAEIVRRRTPGRADAPIEGAEAIDEGRAVRSGGHR